MDLRFVDDHHVERLRPIRDVKAFAGEAPVHATLVDGPTVDLNLMWRRDRWDASVRESVLPAENERQIEGFLERHPEFEAVPVAQVWEQAMGREAPAEIGGGPWLRLSPLRHGTDGFFAACLRRKMPDKATDTPSTRRLPSLVTPTASSTAQSTNWPASRTRS